MESPRIPKPVRRLEDLLLNVKTDEHDEDRGRPAKRQETEALRAALMASNTEGHVPASDPVGIHEGQSVVNFPEARRWTGHNAVARADGHVWNRLTDGAAMQDQPYTQAMQELARVQAIISRDPHKRFLDMYATKTNQRVQALYDQDKLKIMAAREAELAAARRLDMQRKIVSAPEKEKQLRILRSELERVQERLARATVPSPVMRAVTGPSFDYLATGQEENPDSFEYFLETAETALFMERMARDYSEKQAARRGRGAKEPKDYSTVDMPLVTTYVQRLWGTILEAGVPADQRSGDDDRTPEDVIGEKRALDLTSGTYDENKLVELMLAGYAITLCLSRDPNASREGREPYLVTVKRALTKALNWFYVGITGFPTPADMRQTPATEDDKKYMGMKRLIAPFADWQNKVGRKGEEFVPEAANALLEQLAIAADSIVTQLDAKVPQAPGSGGNGQGQWVPTEINLLSAEDREPASFMRRLARSLGYMVRLFVASVEACDIGPLMDPSTPKFDDALLSLIIGDEATATTFRKWFNGTTQPALSSIITHNDGGYIPLLAAGLARFFDAIHPEKHESKKLEGVFLEAAQRGYAHPSIFVATQSVVKLALSGVMTALYDFLGPRGGEGIVNIDERVLDPFMLMPTGVANTLAIPPALIEYVLVPSFAGTTTQPLRLFFATYALNKGVTPMLIDLKKRLVAAEQENASPLAKKRDTTADDSYSIVDVYNTFPALILLHLANSQIRIVDRRLNAERTLAAGLQRDIDEAERILGEITAERHARHGLLNPLDTDGTSNMRDAYQQPLAWAQLPEISGFMVLSPNVTGQLDAARVSLGDHVPTLRDIPLDVLTTSHDSGLAAHFCEYCAVMHARDELAHQTQFGRHEQFPENKRRLFEAIRHLRPYSYSRAGRQGPVTVYRNGTPFRSAVLDGTARGGVETVGLF